MLGAIIGDIVGSRFEWDNYKAKDFEFFTNDCFFTDDSVMSLALCEALLESKPDFSDLREQAVAKCVLLVKHILMPVMAEPFPAGFILATRNLITAMATVRQCA